jgi:HD superfamily phosphodiesterase
MDEKLLHSLKDKARKILENNTRFHCYAHAIEVLENVIKLVGVFGEEKYDKTALFAAALFHDASNHQEKELEGVEGSEIAGKVLMETDGFPEEKINDVKRLIKSINEDREKTNDEIILNTADEMAAFSELGLIRSFMISGNKGMKVREAIEWELAYLEKRYNKLKLQVAKDLVADFYENRKNLLLTSLKKLQ